MTTLPVAFLLVYDLILFIGMLRQKEGLKQKAAPVVLLFFCSGMPALVYQIVWQRALFAIYGVNSESVTVVVSAFMIGLGLGSLFGGWLSAKFPSRSIFLFALAELGTAVFGVVSLAIFNWVATRTSGAPLAYVVLLSLGLLVVPTIFMGATLPLLTDFTVRRYGTVGHSVGTLYFANTFGSAVACYLCATFLLRNFGQSGSVRLAALTNLFVGLALLMVLRRGSAESSTAASHDRPDKSFFSLKAVVVLSGFTAFVSLGFEIVWFRVFVVASESHASAFALLLATFLAGIAAGAFLAGKLTEKTPPPESAIGMGMALLVVGALSPVLLPLVAFLKWKGLSYLFACTGFFLVATLLGAVFPILCKLGLTSREDTGRGVGFIYVANILGSAAGSLLVGFVLMNYCGMRCLAAALGAMAIIIGFSVFKLVHKSTDRAFRVWPVLAFSVLVFLAAQKLYFAFPERLNFGTEAAMALPIVHFVENRNGTITVLSNGAVFGDGVYDGFYNVDPIKDKNMIVRAYAIGAFHPSPRHILMIGLSSGSWAQVLVNHPRTEFMEIVEINPGYLDLIRQYPAVSSLLQNPKAQIHIDDGRRWLLAHPNRQFDLIVQNTSFYWRDHSSGLLSNDYLRIVRRHLAPGGIFYYNTTGSDDVVATGLSVFPYGLRVVNFLAVSDSPISVDKERWVSLLQSYKIDGQNVFDAEVPDSKAVIQKYCKLADSIGEDQVPYGMEDAASLRRRIKGSLIFSDDNMGWEWR